MDHRHFGTIERNALTLNIRAFWDITSNQYRRRERAPIDRPRAVVAHGTHATSQEGVEIESGEIIIPMVDGDLLNRCEIFNETDLDAALARFEELSRPTPWLENAATRTVEQFFAHFGGHNWDAMAELLADDVSARRSPFGGKRRHPTRSRSRDGELARHR